MEKSNAIVTCAFREPYVTHNERQIEAIRSFKYLGSIYRWIDSLPYSEGVVRENIVERFQKSLYGFKPHAIQFAIDKGYEKVIWFDPSVLPVTSPDILFESLDIHPMLVITGDAPLVKMCNAKSLKYFGLTENDIKDYKHIGGTVYGFNFKFESARMIFDLWKQAEVDGIFGTQDDFMAGHWADEACLALAMARYGRQQYTEQDFVYLNQKNI